jgi:hypothetical protein
MPKALKKEYKMRSKVWPYPGMAGWRFLTLPKKYGQEIRKNFGGYAKGWGSLPVSVTIKKTTWKTSIFPDKNSGSYVLPLKSKIRKMEDISDHSTVSFTLSLI